MHACQLKAIAGAFVLLVTSACSKSSSSTPAAPPEIADPEIKASDYTHCAAQNINTSLNAQLVKTISNELITVTANANLAVKVTSSTGKILFDIESSSITATPEYARGTVVDKLNGTTGTIDLIQATDAELVASGYLTADADIDCHIFFVGKQLARKDDGVQKLISYSPPLPFAVYPGADDAKLVAYFATKPTFAQIVATAVEVYGATTVVKDSKVTGSVTVSGSGLDYTFQNSFGSFDDYDIASLGKSNRFKITSGAYAEVDMNYEIMFDGSTKVETLNVQFR